MDLSDHFLPPWFSTPAGESILILAGIAALIAALFWLLCLLSRPSQARERSKLLLDLLEHSLQRSGNPGLTFASLLLREKGARLTSADNRLCLELEKGEPLVATLCDHEYRLPHTITQTLKAGEKTGCLTESIQACREMLGTSHATDVRAYQQMLSFSAMSIFSTLLLTYLITASVGSKLYQVAFDFDASTFERLHGLALSMDLVKVLLGIPVLTLLLWMILETLGGWVGMGILSRRWPRLATCELWVPWKRLRVLRHFTRMFCLVEKAGMTEADALRLAAQSTGNAHWTRWATHAVQQLAQGTRLVEVIRTWDVEGEFEWRLSQYGGKGARLQKSLESWCTYLTWKAAQEENRTKQFFAAAILLGNGVVVGLQAYLLFTYLTDMMETVNLW